MRPEELAEGRRLCGNKLSNPAVEAQSAWRRWARRSARALLNLAERTQKAEAERDQALADLAAVREMLKQSRADTKNWRPALASAERERDQALAELEKAKGLIGEMFAETVNDLSKHEALKAAARALLCTMPVSFRGLVHEKSKALGELL